MRKVKIHCNLQVSLTGKICDCHINIRFEHVWYYSTPKYARAHLSMASTCAMSISIPIFLCGEVDLYKWLMIIDIFIITHMEFFFVRPEFFWLNFYSVFMYFPYEPKINFYSIRSISSGSMNIFFLFILFA